MAHEYQATKDIAADEVDHTAQTGQETTEQILDEAQALSTADAPGYKPTDQPTAPPTAQPTDRPTEVKEKTGSKFQQATEKTKESVTAAMDKVKQTFSSNK